MEPNINQNTTNPQTVEAERLPGRDDITFSVKGNETEISWYPKGPGLKENAAIHFSLPTAQLSKEEIAGGIEAMIGSTAAPTQVTDIFGSELFKRLIETGSLRRIENCSLENVTLSPRDLGQSSLALVNVSLKDARICLSGGTLSLQNVNAESSTLTINSTMGDWSGVRFDKATTLQGDLGKTHIAKDCSLKCRAIKTNFKEVNWEEPESLKARMGGFTFSESLINLDVFKAISKELTKAEVAAANLKKNQQFNSEALTKALCGEPLNGKLDTSESLPLHKPETVDIAISHVRLVVEQKDEQGGAAPVSYLVEIHTPAVEKGLPDVVYLYKKEEQDQATAAQTVLWKDQSRFETYEEAFIEALELRKKRGQQPFQPGKRKPVPAPKPVTPLVSDPLDTTIRSIPEDDGPIQHDEPSGVCIIG